MRASRQVLLAAGLAALVVATGCATPAAPTTSKPTARGKAVGGYQLRANSRIEAAQAIATDGADAPAIVYATEAQVVNAMETANLAAVQAAGAEAKAQDALARAQAAQKRADEAVAKAIATGDAAALAATRAEAAAQAAEVAKAQAALAESAARTAAAQAALVDAKAEAALAQAAQGLVKAQQAVDAATAAGNSAAAATAAAQLASAEAKLVDAKAQAAASAAALADAKAAAAAGQAQAALAAAQAAQTKADGVGTSLGAVTDTANAAAAQAQAAAASAAAAAQAAQAAAAAVTTPPPGATVATFVGLGAGFADGARADARFQDPSGLDMDAAGNLYVADAGNHRLRKVAPDGTTTTLAGGAEGFADGAAADARFAGPYGVAVAADGAVFVADTGNHRIRMILNGQVTTLAGDGTAGFADGAGAAARFHTPFSLAVAADGTLVVADAGNRRVRRVTRAGAVTTIAGGSAGHVNGPLAGARFMVPNDVAVGPTGLLYVADGIAHDVRVIDLAAGVVSTLAGATTAGIADGRGFAARFNAPSGLAVAPNGDLLVADSLNHAIRRITPDGVVTLLAGGNPGLLDRPTDVVAAPNGDLYVSDTNNHRLRKITR